jgi:hypothetical protein
MVVATDIVAVSPARRGGIGPIVWPDEIEASVK